MCLFKFVMLGMGRAHTLSDVIISLVAEELKRESQRRQGASSSSAQALYSSSKGKFQKNKKPFNNASSSNSSGPWNSTKKNGPCNWCRILGHFECRKKLAGEPRKPMSAQAYVNAAKPTVLVCYPTSLLCTTTTWYIDSGATNDISFQQNLLEQF